MAPSWTSSIAAAPMTGLVSDAMRKIASRPIGAGSPAARCPAVVTWTWPPRATSATRPGTAPLDACLASAASSAASPSSVNPPAMRSSRVGPACQG